MVVLEPTLLLRVMGIAPQQVEDLLLALTLVRAQLDLDWSLDRLDPFDVLDGWPDTAMAAENLLLFICHDGSQGHVLESLVDLGEHAVGVVDVLSEPLGALVSESKVLVDVLVLVVSSQEYDLPRVLEFQGKEEADDLEVVRALVDVISKEHVVEGVNVSVVVRGLPDVEKPHQIDVLSVQVANDLHWRPDFLDDDGLSSKDGAAFVRELDDVLFLARELPSWLQILALFGLHQGLQEHLAE